MNLMMLVKSVIKIIPVNNVRMSLKILVILMFSELDFERKHNAWWNKYLKTNVLSVYLTKFR